MTITREQWMFLGVVIVGWLYYSKQTATAPVVNTSVNTGGATVSTDNATVQNYGLPSWQDLASKFNMGD